MSSICERLVEPLLTVIVNCFIALAPLSTCPHPLHAGHAKISLTLFFKKNKYVRHAKLHEKRNNLEVTVFYTFINNSARFNIFCH